MPRALRLIAAATATVSITLFSLGLIVVSRGRRLEDACVTEPPPQWASEFTAMRGPLAEGLTTFRCVKMASPEDSFVFTDIVPLVVGVIVAIAAVSVVAVVWMWAVRPSSGPLPARPTEPQDPPRESTTELPLALGWREACPPVAALPCPSDAVRGGHVSRGLPWLWAGR